MKAKLIHQVPDKALPDAPAATLDYSVSPPVWRLPQWQWWLRSIAVLSVLAAVVVGLWPLNMYRVDIECDAVTGTVRETTRWPFGITTGPRLRWPSPLVQQLQARNIPWTPNWQHMTSRSGNVFGQPISLECSIGPPIYMLQPGLAHYAASCSDDELREFVAVMQNGSDEEQRAKIKAAVEKVFAIDSANGPH